MLTLTIADSEYYNEDSATFVSVKGKTIDLEHSLVSISKWESKWCKAFLGKEQKTREEEEDYIRCMIIDRSVSPEIINGFSKEQFEKVAEYIEHKMTATTFSNINNGAVRNEVVTSELIYYWMISLNIPFECQKWHLNRLLTLIQVCSIKNTPPKKVSRSAILNRNAMLNAERKKQLNTKG